MIKQTIALILAAFTAVSAAYAQQSVEIIHWWTSGGEAAALNLLKADLEKQGVKWVDLPVVGGGGEAQKAAVRASVLSFRPPTAVQMLGYDILDWGRSEVLADLSELASKENWDRVVPKALQKFSKYNEKWIAAPVNIHSTNWVWANKSVLTKAGVLTEPKTWEEFISAAEKVQQAGFIALAHGGQPWQEAIIFDGVVLATGGVDFYRKAFVELDPKVLASPTTEKIFQRMSQLRKLVDKDSPGRDWNVTTGLVINGKAAFQIMGDWAKGEFTNAKKVPGVDFLCFRFPGTQGMVSFNSDQFAMFRVGPEKVSAQLKLASAILNPTFQSTFNVAKGSAPARTDVADTAFDICGKKGIRDVNEADRNNSLVGSIALGHAVTGSVKDALIDVITRHFNGQLDDRAAAAKVVSIAKLKSLHMHLGAYPGWLASSL